MQSMSDQNRPRAADILYLYTGA